MIGRSKASGLESHWLRFKTWASSFILQCLCLSEETLYKPLVPYKIVTNHTGRATEFGTKKMEEFERTWPASFHRTLHIGVATMVALVRTQIKVNNMKIDT